MVSNASPVICFATYTVHPRKNLSRCKRIRTQIFKNKTAAHPNSSRSKTQEKKTKYVYKTQ